MSQKLTVPQSDLFVRPVRLDEFKKLNSKLNEFQMDAVEQGCTVCEVEQCDTNVGYGM